MRRAGLLSMFLVMSLLAQAPQDPANGSIEGVVLNIVNGEPVEGARLRLGPTAGSPYPASEYREIPETVTGADGKFVMSGLKAAVYTFVIDGNGWVQQRYGQKTFPGEGTPIVLMPGQVLKGITVRLTPTGVVSGTIRQADTRQATAGVPVQLMRVAYDTQGERTLQKAGIASTNDRGEFRLYFITPGRYYVSAGGTPQRTTLEIPPGSRNQNQIPVDYAVAFYPGVINTQDATMVEVKPGTDIGGIDFSVNRQALYAIRGRVVDTRTGQPPTSFNVYLYRRSDTRWESAVVSPAYTPASGDFTLGRFGDGSYQLVVQAQSGPRQVQRVLPAPQGPRVIPIAFQTLPARPVDPSPNFAPTIVPIQISGADVEGLVIPVSPGIVVAGSVSVEGRTPLNLESLRIVLRSPDGLISRPSQLTTTSGAPGQGTLRVDGVVPGRYRVQVSGLPTNFYVKQAGFGGVDALRTGLQIADRETNTLNVVLSPNVASVEGVVRNERRDVVGESVVVLVPDQRDRTELFQTTTADREGRFRFPGAAPGTYKIFAWEALERYAYLDPDLLQRVEQKGKAIQLAESATQAVDLTVIPIN